MSKKKFLKIIGIVILVLLLLILIHIVRNAIILTNLQNKVANYENNNNFYVKVTTQFNGETPTTLVINQYQKGEKQLYVMERTANDDKVKLSYYNNGNRIDLFIDTENEKTAVLGEQDSILGLVMFNTIKTENIWQKITISFASMIRTVNVNGHECYTINNFISPEYLAGKNKTEYCIDKETGLVMKTILDESVSEREYEFGNVDDSIFVEPDLSRYTLKSNEQD